MHQYFGLVHRIIFPWIDAMHYKLKKSANSKIHNYSRCKFGLHHAVHAGILVFHSNVFSLPPRSLSSINQCCGSKDVYPGSKFFYLWSSIQGQKGTGSATNPNKCYWALGNMIRSVFIFLQKRHDQRGETSIIMVRDQYLTSTTFPFISHYPLPVPLSKCWDLDPGL